MKKLVYVVDDEDMPRRVARRMFEFNYNVQEFKTGESVLEEIATNQPDLVFTDTDLSKTGGALKGYEVCDRIKTEYPNVKVIGVSGVSDNREKYTTADAYFDKPYTPREVLDKTKELLGE